jgi:predicted glycogen debranching enzyme
MQDEYIITNRLGGFCSSTFHFGNTRRYHGLLVVSEKELERKVIINRIEEKILFHGREEFLNTNLYKNETIQPSGHKWLKSYTLEKDIVFNYEIDIVKITKTIHLDNTRNLVNISYQISTPAPVSLKLTPLLTFRNINELKKFSDVGLFSIQNTGENVKVFFPDEKILEIGGSFTEFFEEKYIYRDFEYPVEQKRGYDFQEDLISAGNFVFDLASGTNEVNICFEYLSQKPDIDTKLFSTQQKSSLNDSKLKDFHNFLIEKSEDFLVKTYTHHSIIAGYHWFEDWGRDTFLSFEGLVLTQKRFELAKQILLEWTSYIKNGLVANRPEFGEYNSLDATLLYIISIYKYWLYTKDDQTVKNLLPQIAGIIEKLILGTDYEIYTLKNGILLTDQKEKALTWMDAVVDNVPVTPRANAPVEIQMLWFNVLNMYKDLEEHFNKSIDLYYLNTLINNLKQTFNKVYWVDKIQYLADFLDREVLNIQIRPNPVIGLSLPFDMLTQTQNEIVLERINLDLLTPVGLKTLDGKDSDYQGTYQADQKQRDLSYHNGTVWPWLLGLHLKSYLKVFSKSQKAIDFVEGKLALFWDTLRKKKLNYIPEVFSADALEPNGCIHQAWNYATLLEVFNELEQNK